MKMRRKNSNSFKLPHAKLIAAALISVLLAGCAAVAPSLKKEHAGVKTQVMVTLTSQKGKLKKKCTLAWSEPYFRMEVRGFLNEPVAALSADAGHLRIYLYQSNLYYDEEVKDAGPALCRLFSGSSANPFIIKLNRNTLNFKLKYEQLRDGSELPYAVELYGKESGAKINFIRPDTSFVYDPELFRLKVPETAVKISEDAIVRSLESWIN